MIGKKVVMELRRKVKVSDGLGGYTISWAGLRNITGVLSAIRGSERFAADKITVVADFYFYIDYPIGETITEEDIFQYSTRQFKIIYITNMGHSQDKRLRITLKEEV